VYIANSIINNKNLQVLIFSFVKKKKLKKKTKKKKLYFIVDFNNE